MSFMQQSLNNMSINWVGTQGQVKVQSTSVIVGGNNKGHMTHL